MEDDWDLQAVVRGCTTTSTTTTATTSSSSRSFMADLKPRSSWFSTSLSIKQDESLLCFPDSFDTRNAIEELHELYKPFFPKSQPLSSSLGGSKDQSQQQQQQQQQQSKQFCGAFVTTAATASTSTVVTHSQSASRSKRRKTQQKKVCQVPAEGLSSDTWSWRKYGQKPIKGSPYPRGYYRCSSSKGCLARKQVERNRSDPTMFIITYTAEHNHPVPTHRNSLAGTTRHQKPLTPPQPSSPSSMAAEPNNNPSTKPSSSSSPTTSMEDDVLQQQQQQSMKVEIRVDGEEEDNMVEDCDDEDELGFPDMEVTDDFFEGLDEIAGPVTGDSFSDHLPASFSLPWMANNAAAAAGSS